MTISQIFPRDALTRHVVEPLNLNLDKVLLWVLGLGTYPVEMVLRSDLFVSDLEILDIFVSIGWQIILGRNAVTGALVAHTDHEFVGVNREVSEVDSKEEVS